MTPCLSFPRLQHRWSSSCGSCSAAISPLIWRRLLVRCDATIADLHATLQLALGWTDEHLNRFVIQGRD